MIDGAPSGAWPLTNRITTAGSGRCAEKRSGGNRDESHRRAICQIAGLDEAILARNRKPSLGIDVARYGDSETVIMQREGGWARIAWAGGKLSTMERPATLCTSRSNERRAGSQRLGEDVRRRRWSGRRSL